MSGREPAAAPWVLLPAAGAARRMGCPKLRLPWPTADSPHTVLESTLEAFLAGGVSRALVVVAPEDEALAALARRLGAVVTSNPAPERGMLSSIRAGLAHLAALGHAPHPLLVAPADLPRLRASTVAAMLAHWQLHGCSLAVPRHAGRRGHPLLVASTLLPAIATLDEAVGLRQLLAREAAALCVVEVEDAGIHTDLDTPADLPPGLHPTAVQAGR
jgi:molybdenum cofactor cytidylyltransferase